MSRLAYNFSLNIKIYGIGLFNTLIDQSIFYNLNDDSYTEKTLMVCVHSSYFNSAKTFISPGLKAPKWNGPHVYSAFTQSALLCCADIHPFTHSCTHSHANGGVHHAGRQPARQEQLG